MHLRSPENVNRLEVNAYNVGITYGRDPHIILCRSMCKQTAQFYLDVALWSEIIETSLVGFCRVTMGTAVRSTAVDVVSLAWGSPLLSGRGEDILGVRVRHG